MTRNNAAVKAGQLWTNKTYYITVKIINVFERSGERIVTLDYLELIGPKRNFCDVPEKFFLIGWQKL